MARYDAFISYSHAADDRLAPATRRALEQLARPWRRRRALRVFQDHTGLAASPDLWDSIAGALAEARYFVLLASPEASASHWVQQELEEFLRHHPVDHVLLALTNGELRWDRTSGDFATTSTALPPQLQGRYGAEPLWVDLRWASTEAHLDVRNTRFRSAMADLAAPIYGLARDDLDAEDLHEYRRARRVRTTATAIVALLAVTATISTLLAIGQRNDARNQRATATKEARIASSRDASFHAAADRSRSLEQRLLLGVHAVDIQDDPNARAGLIAALQDATGLDSHLTGIDSGVLAAATSSITALSIDSSGMAQWWIRRADVYERDGGQIATNVPDAVSIQPLGPGRTALVVGTDRAAVVSQSPSNPPMRVSAPLTASGTAPLLAAASTDGTIVAFALAGETTVTVVSERGAGGESHALTFCTDGVVALAVADPVCQGEVRHLWL
jgi:hypothetical protein